MAHEYTQVAVDDTNQQASQRQPRETKRVNVNFSPSAYAALQALAADTGKSLSEVLRDAIALNRWFYDVTHEPGTHLLVERDGKTREILPFT